MREGEPWFVANDIAKALGYSIPKDAVAQHCKYAELLKGGDSPPLTNSPRGINITPESDVYALIFRSNLPQAEDFRRWVCEEVLPSIRKTGKYAVKPERKPLSVSDVIAAVGKEFEEAGITNRNLRLLALDSAIQKATGFKVLEAAHMDLAKASGEPVLTVKDIVLKLGPDFAEPGVKIILMEMGLQEYSMREWQLTSEGEEYGREFPPVYDRRRKTLSDYNIKWRPIIVDKIRLHLGLVAEKPAGEPGDFCL